MNDLLVLALPLVWALVATIVALLLYKSSSGWLEGGQLFGLPINGLRLGGSVVIFFVAFMLLKNSTPADNLAIDRRDKAIVDKAQLRSMDERAGRIEDLVVELNACMQIDSSGTLCDPTLASIRRESALLRRDFAAFRPSPAGTGTRQPD